MFKKSSHNASLTEIHHHNLAFVQLLRNFKRKVQILNQNDCNSGRKVTVTTQENVHLVQATIIIVIENNPRIFA